MTKLTELSEFAAMRHCDDCPMPHAYEASPPHSALLQHAFIVARECIGGDQTLVEEARRGFVDYESDGQVFDTAMQCLRCSEGLVVIVNGVEEHQGRAL